MARTGRALGCLLVAIAGALSLVPPALSGTALPAGPVGTFQTASGDHPTAGAVAGQYAYVVTSCGAPCYGPLDVLDVADPASPTLAGTTPVSWGADAIALQGAYAYVTGYEANPNFMRIVSVAPPSNLGSVAAFTLPSDAPLGIAVRGGFAYMLDNGANRLDVIDVSDPGQSGFSVTENTSPNSLPVVAERRLGAGPSRLALQGARAYVVDTVADEAQVVSIADPSRPRVIGTSAPLGPRGTGGLAQSDIAVAGAYAYVANFDADSLQVIDVAHPRRPLLVAAVPAGSQPDAIALAGHFAFVAGAGSDTVDVYDVADPRRPVPVGSLASPGEPDAIAIAGGKAYVADYVSDTLQIFDVSGIVGA